MIGTVRRRGLMGLPGQDNGPVDAPDGKGLMPVGVSGRRDELHIRKDLDVAVDNLVVHSVEVHKLRKRVVVNCLRGSELGSLREYRPSGKLRVATTVIEMQVAVHHPPHVAEIAARPMQGISQRCAYRPVVGVDLGMTTHARVEQEQASWQADKIAETGFNAWLTSFGLLGGAHEIAEVDSPNITRRDHGEADLSFSPMVHVVTRQVCLRAYIEHGTEQSEPCSMLFEATT